MNIETGDPDGQDSFARISFVNGALMLITAASDPALDPEYRDAAEALADTYQTSAALGTIGMSTRPGYLASIDDLNAKTNVMEKLCGS